MEHAPFDPPRDRGQESGPYLRWATNAPTSSVVHAPSHRDGDSLVVLAAAVAGSIPIPWLDTLSSSAIRGAAMRRVAARHGIGLSTGARRILGYADLARYQRFRLDRPIASLATRVVARIGLVALTREVLTVSGSIHMFDAYLESRERDAVEEIDANEARRIRAAIERALERSLDESVSLVPTTIGKTITSVLDSLRRVDEEGRSTLEAALDPLVDTLADIPSKAEQTMRAAFEDELAHLRLR